MIPAAIGLFFVLFPALLIYACGRWPLLDKLGPAPLAYLAGIALSLAGVVPPSAAPVQEGLLSATVPLAIPLMLFSMDLKKWLRLTGPSFFSFGLMMLAVVLASATAYLVMGNRLEESWKVSGMLIGVYTGGTPNLSAIGLALEVKQHLLVLVNTADMLLGMPWLLFVLFLAQRLFVKFLRPFSSASGGAGPEGDAGYSEDMSPRTYVLMFRKGYRLPLLGAFGLAAAAFAVSAGLYLITPKDYNMAVLMLSVTTLAIGCSFIPKVRNTPLTFALGQYFILIFCLTVGSLAEVSRLFGAALDVFVYVFIVMYGAFALHVVLAKLFRIDADTVLITATAAIMSPPFVPVVASALKNREIVMSGLATGIFGYAVGNYLGISFAHLIRAVFG